MCEDILYFKNKITTYSLKKPHFGFLREFFFLELIFNMNETQNQSDLFFFNGESAKNRG